MLPSPDILNEFEHGKFVLSNLAAKRAKQLREGAPPLVRIDSNHPLTIALAEIAAGRIKPTLPAVTELLDENLEVQILTDASMPLELGLLLPSLDEVEQVPDEDDHDDEPDDEETATEKVVSLADLADDDDADDADEDDSSTADSDDETLSLTDIAEKESDDESESDD